jgi:hypothetical protein
MFSRWIQLNSSLNVNNETRLVSPRARALLTTCGDDILPPNGGLFACGGYHKAASGELVSVPEILCYDKSMKHWICLSEIPNVTKSHIFAIDNNILIISDKIKSDNLDGDDEHVPVAKYDLAQRKWLMIDGKLVDETQSK